MDTHNDRITRRCTRTGLGLVVALGVSLATPQVGSAQAPPPVPATDAPATVAPATVAPATVAPNTGAAADALRSYRQRAFSAEFSFWNGLRLLRGGNPAELGFFGGNYQQLFAGSNAALDSMGTYRTLRVAGTIMWATGLAVLVAELVILAADRDLFIEEDFAGNNIKPLFWGLLIPAGVVGISGGLMMQGANGYLSDAIRQYNNDLAQRLGGNASANAPRKWVLSIRRHF